MNTIWKCKCGQENSIVIRYCPKCSEEIPHEEINSIANEEFTEMKRIYEEELLEFRQTRANARYDFLRKTYHPTLATILLGVVIVAFLFVQGYTGVIKSEEVYKNYGKLVTSPANKIYAIADNSFTVIKTKLLSTGEGLDGFLNAQDIKYNKTGVSLDHLINSLGGKLQELENNIGKIYYKKNKGK
jgi:hypothetical protein